MSDQASRREFLQYSLGMTAFVSAVAAWAGSPEGAGIVITENAEGILVTDTARCVGCRRCELACTEYNDGRAQPARARIRVARNLNFGPRGQRSGVGHSMGQFGNFRVIQDTCLQCPHPVPCATACPHDAIVADEKTRARVVDRSRCAGCMLCLRACPWEMIVFDTQAGKADKCFLCRGEPECAAACPAQALRYLPWRDLTRAVPIRQAPLAIAESRATNECSPCHDIGRRKP